MTGATSGLGKALAEEFLEGRNSLLVTGRREELLKLIAADYIKAGLQCELVAGDITDQSVRQQLIEKCEYEFGGMDCLVNNAGVGAMGRFDQADPQRLKKVFEVNVFAMMELTRLAIPLLKSANKSMIVNIGSVLGHRAVPLKSEYSASKFAVHGFSDALRAELALDKIDVLHVCPGTIDTEFFESAVEDATKRDWKAGGKMTPDYVAQKVIRAMERGKHELTLPSSAKMLVWLDRLFPTFANFLVAKFGQ